MSKKQNIERTVMFGAAGREGSFEITDYDELLRVTALMNFFSRGERKFKEQYGLDIDLNCSVDMVRKMANAPEKFKFFIAVEQGENMRYELRCFDDRPFKGWDDEEGMESRAKEHGLDLFVVVRLDDERALIMSGSFNEELEYSKPTVDEMWMAIQKGEDAYGTYHN